MTIVYDPTYNGVALPVTIVSGGGSASSSVVTTLYTVIVQFVDGSITNHVGDTIQQVQLISDTGTIISSTWTNLTQNAVLSTAPAPGTIAVTSANPLTDAQLRASPVPMTTTQLPPALGPQAQSDALAVYLTNSSTLDNFPVTNIYTATAASTGVDLGDVIQNLAIYDGGTVPATLLSSTWSNLTQGTTLAGAPPANTLAPLVGAGLTDAQLRASPVAMSTTQLPTNIGATTKSGSVSVALATDTGNLPVTTTQLPTTIGATTKSGSVSVALATDTGNLPVTTTQLPTTIGATTKSGSVSVALATDTGDLPVTTTQLPTTIGATTKAGSVSVALATDTGTLPVSATQLPAALGQTTKNDSMSVTIASDNTVATSTTQLPSTLGQTTKNSSVSVAIASDNTVATSATQLPSTLGQKTMANSMAVTLASDQSAIPVTIGALPTSIYSNQLTVNFTAQALANQTFSNGVIITANGSNAGNVYVGPSGVTGSTGYLLVPGQSIAYAVQNSNVIYVLGSNTTDVVTYTGN